MNTKVAQFYLVWSEHKNLLKYANLADDKIVINALGRDLVGQHLTIATTQNPPLNYAEWENGKWIGKGIAFEFIKYIQDRYPFNYTVTVPPDIVLGNKTAGVFGLMGDQKADIAAAFLPKIDAYNHFVDYSPTLDVGEWVVFMKRPIQSATGSGLLAPFTFEVWILILIFLLGMAPVVSFFIFLHKKLCPGEQNLPSHIFSALWFVYGAIVKQGSTMLPSADSTRLIFATWWIFITVLTAFYTANLTAFLTLSVFTLPVAKPEDIGDKGYTWVTDRGNTIEEAADNVLKDALKGSKGHYVYESRDSIVYDIVMKKDYLYLGEKPQVDHIMYREWLVRASEDLLESLRCVYVITTWPVLARERVFLYKKDFKFKRLFDHIILHLMEGGCVKYKVRFGLPKAPVCPLDLKSIERQLRNTDFLLTYYVISTGYGLSFLSFVLEFLFGLICRSQLYVREEKPRSPFQSTSPTLPPAYHTLFDAQYNHTNGEKPNGNDYWVEPTHQGRNVGPRPSILIQYAQ
ncbi:hypothetical protein PPYR_03408 [Photinus pyralis]|uniref:Ionotropic glutamate receptor C-terminal domain-containing protein n=3 Tax=Photinus pyralis TaxID=7054 RepID=A0A1Y1KM84_PHOPY|nr:hypothetical protein PPYR_03408 [Photinus pyralis]